MLGYSMLWSCLTVIIIPILAIIQSLVIILTVKFDEHNVVSQTIRDLSITCIVTIISLFLSLFIAPTISYNASKICWFLYTGTAYGMLLGQSILIIRDFKLLYNKGLKTITIFSGVLCGAFGLLAFLWSLYLITKDVFNINRIIELLQQISKQSKAI